jgi:hypothetical protein
MINTMPEIKSGLSSISKESKKYFEQLTNKQFYEKNSYFLDLNSYSDFFSKDLYNLVNYVSITNEYLKKIYNKINSIDKYLSLFSLELLKKQKFKKQIFKNLFFNVKNLVLSKKKINFKKSFFTKNNFHSIFSYVSEKSLFTYKSPIFIIELLFLIKKKENFMIKNIKIYYIILKTIYKHQKTARSFLKFIYYSYLLKKELTKSEFFFLKAKFFLYHSLLIFRKQLIKKVFSLNQKIQTKIDFQKTYQILKNIRIYFNI